MIAVVMLMAQQELGLGGALMILLLLFGFASFAVCGIAYAANGIKGILQVMWFPFMIASKLLAPVLLWGGRTTISGLKGLTSGERQRRVSDPTNAELERRRTVRPAKERDVRALANGYHYTVGGVVEAVHKALIAMAGAGKNQTDLNYELQHQLMYSPEHIILTDPKTNAPLSKIVYAYARPEDRIFVYSFHPKDRFSSALRLFRDPGELSDLAFMLTDEPEAKDSHWNEKAAEAIAAIATALTELRGEAEEAAARFAGEEQDEGPAEITATLNEVRDVIADRRKLEELREISPLVDNVADVDKEWGFIRSTGSRRLTALANKGTRRVFAGGPGDPQPDFSRTNGRDIVIVRPYPRSAKRLSRYVYAVLDAVYRAAADGGDAGGPGTKVLIDEAASYMKLANLAEYLDLGRESKVCLTYVLQGTKQLASKIGKDDAEHVLSSTEVKIVGATSDIETAKFISELSQPTTVHYRRAAQSDELLGQLDGHQRRMIEPYEITSQGEGEWTCQQGGRVWKVKVPKAAYHHTQASPTREHPLWGVADSSGYKVPPILAAPEENETIPEEEYAETMADDLEKTTGDRRGGGRRSQDAVPEDGPPAEEDADDWIE